MPGTQFVIPRPAPGNGSYRYTLNGEPTGVHESFEVVIRDDGWEASTVRTAPGGTELRAEVNARDGGAACELSFRTGASPQRRATYRLRHGELEVSLQGAAAEQVGSGWDGTALLSPLLRVFQGPAIAGVIGAGGRLAVVVPKLDPDDPDTLLAPVVEVRSAQRLGVEALGEDGHGTPWRRCSYIGGNYDDAAEFWLDERDRLVRYRFPQAQDQLWEVELVQ